MIAQFTRICSLSDLTENQVKGFSINGREIVLAMLGGKVFALDNLCTHDGGDLGDGEIIEGQLQCPRHGGRFDLQTGAPTRMPVVEGIEAYDVKIEDGDIYVAIPNL